MNKALQILQDRGFINACTDINGLSDLMDRGKISFYVGVDPTGPSLHIGHIVPFFAMHYLQAEGYKPVALLGGGTGLIGDPSGKTEMRKILSYKTIDDNCKRIKKQLSCIVDFAANPPKGYGKAIAKNNADWLRDLNYIEFLRDIGSHFSVNRMLTFEGVKQRLERGLSFLEFNYQLLQSYDFYILNRDEGCRLQIGGADQWGNIVAGTDLIGRLGGPQCYGLTFNLITRADGAKMGKSEKGAVFLDKELYSVYDFFQYWRNVPDEDVEKFFKIFTFLSLEEIKSIVSGNINLAKEKLAYEVTKIIHGKIEADNALNAAKSVFSGGTKGMPQVEISKSELSDGLGILKAFVIAGLSKTNSESRRFIEGGGAMVNGQKVVDVKAVVTQKDFKNGELVLQIGKKHFSKIVLK